MILSISMFSIAYCIGADTYPIWSMINMLTIILYFPLQNVQLSGEASIFIKEFLKVQRLDDLKIGRLFFYYGITDEFDRDFLADRGHNIYFEQFGYTSRYIIFNCTLAITIIVFQIFICMTTGIYETVKAICNFISRKLNQKNTAFAQTGRMKQ